MPRRDTQGVSVRLKSVWLWPDGGRAGRPWVSGSVGGDALARAGAVVKAQLPSVLAVHEARLRASIVQVFVEDGPAVGPDLELTVFDDFDGGFEAARVAVPSAVADLTAEQLWWLAFDVLRAACGCLHEVVGGGDGPWLKIESEMLAKGPVEQLVTAWKSAPDRRHRARLVTEVRPHRPAETWIELATAKDETPIGRSPKVVSSPPPRGLRPPRWDGSDMAVAELFVDRGGRTLRFEQLVVALSELEPVESSPPPAPLLRAPDVPSIRVVHFSADDPSRPSSVDIGPINGEPWLLPQAHRRAWESVTAMKKAEIEAWWATSEWATLLLSVVTMPGVTRTASGRDGRDLWVEAALEPDAAAVMPPEVAALNALQSALDRAAQRAKIPPLTFA